LDGGQDIRRRAGDGVASDGKLPIDVVARFGHRDAEPERRQLARRRRIGAGLQTVSELPREVDAETGEISDWIVRQLARLPGEWNDAVDVGDINRENGLLVPSKARPSRNHLGRDDIRVLVVHRLERREVKVGRWVASSDVEAWRVVFVLGRDGAVGGCLPLQYAAVVQKVDAKRHLGLSDVRVADKVWRVVSGFQRMDSRTTLLVSSDRLSVFRYFWNDFRNSSVLIQPVYPPPGGI